MSARAGVISAPLGLLRGRRARRRELDPAVLQRRAQVYRLAFGMTLSSAIAFWFAWPLAFIAPVLAAKMLSLPKVMPLKGSLIFVGLLSASVLLSARYLLPTVRYPAVHLMLAGLILFHLFYYKANGGKPLLVVFALIGVTVIPLVGTASQTLARGVASGLTFGAFVAVGMVYMSAALFPDPPALGPTVISEKDARAAAAGAPALPPRNERIALALRSWIVLFPLYAFFMLYSLVDLAVVLIFASLLGLEARFGQHWAQGKGLILSNLVGGLVAVIIYNVLVWVPAFPFFLLLVLLAGLVVGQLIFSGSPLGKLLAGGITTVFVILGPVITGDAEAGAALYVRVLQIMSAVVYVVVAFGILERLTHGRRVAQ